jgi:hypothetical protein
VTEAEVDALCAHLDGRGRGADVFGQEAVGVGLLAEEPTASFAVGDEADDGAVAMDRREVGDGGSGTAFSAVPNQMPHRSGFQGY